jgi:hypothetical protein
MVLYTVPIGAADLSVTSSLEAFSFCLINGFSDDMVSFDGRL